ncbi:hypothetical protein IE53DRAFT_369964 [Violaceomyces palustris]|uniref:Uncharacterized protein n=1 Tax=Violaceomyces palustris TaxID=1673888 RepID=A0ACD0NTT6_9BASI|nr:hypothetical protein IE53DRAFT_369964 [Violaceomyces palustris]
MNDSFLSVSAAPAHKSHQDRQVFSIDSEIPSEQSFRSKARREKEERKKQIRQIKMDVRRELLEHTLAAKGLHLPIRGFPDEETYTICQHYIHSEWSELRDHGYDLFSPNLLEEIGYRVAFSASISNAQPSSRQGNDGSKWQHTSSAQNDCESPGGDGLEDGIGSPTSESLEVVEPPDLRDECSRESIPATSAGGYDEEQEAHEILTPSAEAQVHGQHYQHLVMLPEFQQGYTNYQLSGYGSGQPFFYHQAQHIQSVPRSYQSLTGT